MIGVAAEPDALIQRPALATRLSGALDRGGVVVVAGAGYGKTTALRQTLATRPGPSVWISCARFGGEAGLLLLALVERLREIVPGSADVLAGRLQTTLRRVDVPALARRLRSDLERLLVEPIVVVVDDAEELDGPPEGLALIEVLLNTDPRALRVAVAGRRPLAVRAGRLAAMGRLTEIGVGELAFTPQECGAVLRRRHGRAPTADEVEVLMARTEGWPLGVTLSAAAGLPGRATHAAREDILAFLDEEVLGGLDAGLRRGVLEAAVAPDLTPPMLEALGLPEDFPARAQQAGLLLRSVDEGARWSFHPLLRELLRSRLAGERTAAEVAAIHGRVAAALAAGGRRREAVEHWLDAGDWREALAVSVGLGQELQRMSPERIRGWLRRLPAEAKEEPGFHLVLGQLEWGRGHHMSCLAPLRAAVAGYDARGDLLTAWVARWILCDALFSVGAFDEIERLAEGWEDPRLAPLSPLPQGVAWYGAFVRLSRGQVEQAEPLLSRLRDDPLLGPLMHPFDRMFTAYIESSRGRIDAASEILAASAGELADHDPGNRAPFVIATRALMQMDCGRSADAMETWGRLADAGAEAGLEFIVSTSRWERAWLHARAGALEEAQLELHRGGPPRGGGWHDRSYSKARAAIALLRGEPEEAVAAAEEALRLVRPVALSFRHYTTCEVAPILVAAGAPALAAAAIEETLAASDEAFPGDRGRWPRARLLTLRAWMRRGQGDTRGAEADIERAWAEARGCEHHLLRVEWARIEPLVHEALERGILDAGAVIGALQHAFPGGAALAGFVDHPVAEVRRAALPAAVASGHPDTPGRVDRLTRDGDPSVAAAAAAAQADLRRTPPPLHFVLLGNFTVRRATWTLDDAVWGRPQVARLVRFLLIHRGAAVPEDDLFAVFWPGMNTTAARRNLAVAMSSARKALDLPGARDSVLHIEGRAHQIRLRPGDRVDTDEFEAAAGAALADGGDDAPALLERAERLWTGEPLPEDRYADWTFAWRERLVARYTHVLTSLTRAYAAAGRQDDALRVAHKWVALDPLNEVAQRELIVGLSRAGRRDHALRQFLSCRRALVDALGIEPSEETRRLQERVLAGADV